MDRAALSRAVSNAVGSENVEVIDWRAHSIHAAFNQSTGGVCRLTGESADRGTIVPWSMVLKAVRPSDDPFGGSTDPLHPNYWAREALIYRSGLLDDLPGIRAPRCYGVDFPDESSAWIWLEDLAEHLGRCWTPGRYYVAAHALGRFNGAYLEGRGLPSADCLSRNWLTAFVSTFEPAFAELHSLRENVLVRRCWPGDLFGRLIELWRDRRVLLSALDGLPQTFCHLDAFPGNLIVDDDAQEVIALDWSFAGVGPIGSELAPMVAASVCFYDAEPAQMWSIDEAVFNGYMEGLAAAWEGKRDVVRFGYTAAAALHYGLFPLGVFLLDQRLRARFERLFGHPARELADRWATLVGFLLDQAAEARELLRVV